MMKFKTELSGVNALITVAEAAQHIRAIPGDEAERTIILEPIIAAAFDFAENRTGRALRPQTINAYASCVDGVLELPRSPVRSVTSVKFYHDDGTSETLTAADYETEDMDGLMVIHRELTHPRTFNPVEIIYTAGLDTLPSAIRQAIMMLIGHWYEHRECIETGAVTSVEVEMTTKAILDQYKAWWF